MQESEDIGKDSMVTMMIWHEKWFLFLVWRALRQAHWDEQDIYYEKLMSVDSLV